MLTLPFHEDNDLSRPECHPPWRLTREGIAGPWAHDPTWGSLPDLSDPATVGALLALVREAWGDPGASVWHDRRVSVWSWMADGCIHGVWRPSDADGYETEAEALVAALEAAP